MQGQEDVAGQGTGGAGTDVCAAPLSVLTCFLAALSRFCCGSTAGCSSFMSVGVEAVCFLQHTQYQTAIGGVPALCKSCGQNPVGDSVCVCVIMTTSEAVPGGGSTPPAAQP